MKRKKDNRKLNSILAIFIAVIMVGSIADIMLNNNDTQLSYNGYKFLVSGNQIYTKIEGENYLFYYFPSDLEGLNMSDDTKDALRNMQMFYFTFDPENKYLSDIDSIRSDLASDLSKSGKFFSNAKTTDSLAYDIPVITCSNATAFVPVVYFKEGERTGFFKEGDCIIAESSSANGFLALKDKMLYVMLGVMD